MKQRVAYIQTVSWDKEYCCDISSFDSVNIGNTVILETQLGLGSGVVVRIAEKEQGAYEAIKRVPTADDALNLAQNEAQMPDAIKKCQELVAELGLEMKIIDVFFALKRQRITFAFIAEGRVDFRELVKRLAQHFKTSIRLQQIGVRDETKVNSDVGSCGQQTCCTRFLKKLGSVTAEHAQVQNVSHRGADRLSGVCGRLACCLKYEQSTYEKMAKGFPKIGQKVHLKTGQHGIVKDIYVLKKSLTLEVGERNYVEVSLSDIRKEKTRKK
jgi:cell fate regulator YaaT (PSP1 superfamily)